MFWTDTTVYVLEIYRTAHANVENMAPGTMSPSSANRGDTTLSQQPVKQSGRPRTQEIPQSTENKQPGRPVNVKSFTLPATTQ